MTPQEAEQIVLLLNASTAGRSDAETRAFFEASLARYSYDLALAAATTGAVTWRRFPSWAEFMEMYRVQTKLAEPERRQEDDLGKRGVSPPEWVYVWSWARFKRQPRNLRFFPQQAPHVEEHMTHDEYEALRQEWVDAGSPKAEHPIPMAR